MRLSKKVAALVSGAAIVVASSGGVAFAYWSTTGSGTGTATTSSGAANLAVLQTSTISNMYPGDAPQSIAGSVTNNAANSAFVQKVVVSVSSVTQAAGATGTCDASDYALTTPEMTVGKDIAAGKSESFSGASIQFNNKSGSNQDGCKGATVNLAYNAS